MIAQRLAPGVQHGGEPQLRAEPFSPKLQQRLACLLYTSDAADERSSVDLGGRRIIKKKKNKHHGTIRAAPKNIEQ